MNQQQPEPFSIQQRLPSEFTQADAIRLQQFNAGLSAAKKQVDDGVITPEDGEVLTQGILRLRAPLLAAQEAQKELIRQQRLNEIQQDAALAQGIQHQDAVFRARGLQERVSAITDPTTGRSAFFYEESPNKMVQIQFGGQRGTEGLEGMTASSSMTPPNPDLGPPPVPGGTGGANPMTPPNPDLGPPGVQGRTGEPPETSGNPADAGPTWREEASRGGKRPGPAEAGDPRVTGMPSLAPDPETGGHVLEIWNGPHRQVVRFDANRQIVSQEFFDQQGFPIQQGQQMGMGEDDELSPAAQRFYHNQAEQQFPPVDPGLYPQTPQGQMAFVQDVQRRERDVSLTAASLMRSALVDRRQQRGTSVRQQSDLRRQEQLREEALAKQRSLEEKEQRAEQKRIKDAYQKRLEHHIDSVGRESLWMDRPFKERMAEARDRLKEEGYADPNEKPAAQDPTEDGSTPTEQPAPGPSKEQVEAMQKLHSMMAGFGSHPTPAPSSAKPSPGATQTGPNTERVSVPAGGHLLGLGEQPLGSGNPANVKPERIKKLRKIVEDRQSNAYFGHSLTREGASLNALAKLLQKADEAGQMTEADRKRYRKLLEDLGKLDVRGQLDLE